MCNAIKIMHSGYVITLTERGKDNLLRILDSFEDGIDQGSQSGVYASEYRFAKKLLKALQSPAGVQRVEVGK